MSNDMQKVLVLGSGGAGKTTFSKVLATILHYELIHLDAYYWKMGWVEPSQDEWKQIIDGLLQCNQWVMDGKYKGTLPQRLAVADTVILLDVPRWQCLWRVINRWWRYVGKTRPDMAKGCPERLTWKFLYYVWTYPKRSRPVVLNMLEDIADRKQVVVLRSHQEVTNFLNDLVVLKSIQHCAELI